MLRHRFLRLLFLVLWLVPLAAKGGEPAPKNKLLEMFRFFYLPFDVEFRVGDSNDEVIPFGNAGSVILAPEEMQRLDQRWAEIRKSWKAKSLFVSTRDTVNGTTKISPHLITHRITANRTALDSLSIEERIRIKEILKDKSKDIQATVLQKQFVRSFIDPATAHKMHFFIIAPDWCASSETYRTLLEAYAKKFALGKFVLHSLVIEDPNEQIFDSKAMNDLFPFPKRYSHESVPRFILAEEKEGDFKVHEEGNALHLLYENYFEAQQGFLEIDKPVKIPSSTLPIGPSLSKMLIR